MPAHDECLMRGHAAATITFNDPVWAAQSYEMDRGERVRGDYDPPLPNRFVDALRDRERHLNALEDLMVAQGRTEVPPLELLPSWARPEGRCCSPVGPSTVTTSTGCQHRSWRSFRPSIRRPCPAWPI